MTAYDRLDWHYDATVRAGQPEENAFTHIGFYLAWLIRHDLHSVEIFPAEHVAAVKSGEMSGSDLADDIDTKLLSLDMNAEGEAFSDARYAAYLEEYGKVFADEPDYSIADEPANYDRVGPVIDRLYADWVADGRPKPPAPDPDADPLTALMQGLPPGIDHAVLAGLAQKAKAMAADIDAAFGSGTFLSPTDATTDQLRAQLNEFANEAGVTVVAPPGPEDGPHAAPEIEALVPRELIDPLVMLMSVPANQQGSSLLNRALKRLGVNPRDATVATAMGGGVDWVAVTLYAVPGVGRDRLIAEFESVVFRPPGSRWAQREIAGKNVRWATGGQFTAAHWARDGLVVDVRSAGPGPVEAAIPRLP